MELTVPAALAGERADRVVALVTGLARAEASALVAGGRLTRNGRVVTTRGSRVQLGDHLQLDLPPVTETSGPAADASVVFTVVHADDDVIVVDKPAGLVVHPGSGNQTGTLVNGLLAHFPDLSLATWPDPSRPGIVHRLDKGTSGLLVVARTVPAMAALATQLHDHRVERRYVALVSGRVDAPAGVIDAPLGRSARDPLRMTVRHDGRPAITRYQVLRRFAEPAPATLLSCRLETGRTHQIRVHLAAIGHPVVGDDRYRRRGPSLHHPIGRPFLHAAELGFFHPGRAEMVRFEAALPVDLERYLAALGED